LTADVERFFGERFEFAARHLHEHSLSRLVQLGGDPAGGYLNPLNGQRVNPVAGDKRAERHEQPKCHRQYP
jgi:hypothetical protein